MIPGVNCITSIWRMVNYADDSVGGAVITGTVVYTGIQTRLDPRPTTIFEQMLLPQGYETQRMFTATVVPHTMQIHERDELEITAPVDSPYYGQKFRITTVDYPSNPRDPKGYIIMALVRSERAHTVQ